MDTISTQNIDLDTISTQNIYMMYSAVKTILKQKTAFYRGARHVEAENARFLLQHALLPCKKLFSASTSKRIENAILK